MKRYSVIPGLDRNMNLTTDIVYHSKGEHCNADEVQTEIEKVLRSTEKVLQSANDANRALTKITEDCYIKSDSITKVVRAKKRKSPRLTDEIERDESDFLYMVTLITILSSGYSEVLEFRDDDGEIFKRAIGIAK